MSIINKYILIIVILAVGFIGYDTYSQGSFREIFGASYSPWKIVGTTVKPKVTTWSVEISNITGSTQCLEVDANGLVSGTGIACGSGSGSEWTDEGTYLRPNETEGIIVSASSTIYALTMEYSTSTQKLVIGSTNPINDAVLFVTGDGYIDGNATTTGSMNVGGDMSVTGNQSITGELTVTGQIPNRYTEEDFSASCDGATIQFTTTNSIATNTEQILWNNKYLTSGVDYTIQVNNTTIDITGLLNAYPCISGDELIINYRTP